MKIASIQMVSAPDLVANLFTSTAKLAADGDAAPTLKSGNLSDGPVGFLVAVNFVSVFSAKVLVHLTA